MAKFLALLVSAILLASPLALAQDIPPEVGPAEGGASDAPPEKVDFGELPPVEFPAAGTTPDSPLYFFDTLFEGVQLALTFSPEGKAALEADIAAERLSESNEMIEKGDYDAAETASDLAEQTLESLQDHVEEAVADGGDTSVILDLQEATILHEQEAEAIHATLEEKALAGEIPQDVVQAIDAEHIEEVAVESQGVVDDKKDDVVGALAEEKGITVIEAEIEFAAEAEKEGVDKVFEAESKKDFAELEKQSTELETKLEDQLKAEKTEESVAASQLVDEAEIKLQKAEDALEAGDSGEAFGQLTAAEHLLDNAEKIAGKEPDAPPVDEARKLVDKEQTERIEEARTITEDYEKIKDELKVKYPDRADEIESTYEQSKKALELSKIYAEEYSDQFNKLKAEGKTDQEATVAISDRFKDEYRKAYGEEFVPPAMKITEKPGEFVEFGKKEAEVMGGVVQDYTYADPVSGYKYEFGKEGYTYTTPVGIVYTEKYPETFKPSKAFEKGNEAYTTKVDTAEGTAEYKYLPTGWEVVKPDGTKEAHAYEAGTYDMMGGGKIDYKPTGYEIKTEAGKEVKYEYNPEFQTYVSREGNLYKPPEGGSIHEEAKYSTAANAYSYDYDGTTWSYNADKGRWTSSGGDVYKPETAVVAPVGHEGDGRYVTQSGETWTYDSSAYTWKSTSGESYTHSTTAVAGAGAGDMGHAWTQQADGTWVSPTGETHMTETSGGTVTGGTYKTATGQNYAYDTSVGTWVPPSTTGTAGGATGGTVTDMHGNVWTQGHEGTWASTTAGTTTTATAGTEAHAGTGMEGTGTYAGTTGTTTGTMGTTTDSTGGTTGTTSGTTDSGGYSAPSGGDAGGYSAPSGGGDTGGGGHSGGGHSGMFLGKSGLKDMQARIFGLFEKIRDTFFR